MDWQPIETAPKDGTEIIGAYISPEYRKVFFVEKTKWDAWNRPGYGGWFMGEQRHSAFTHWMPLPEPPELTGSLAPKDETS